MEEKECKKGIEYKSLASCEEEFKEAKMNYIRTRQQLLDIYCREFHGVRATKERMHEFFRKLNVRSPDTDTEFTERDLWFHKITDVYYVKISDSMVRHYLIKIFRDEDLSTLTVEISQSMTSVMGTYSLNGRNEVSLQFNREIIEAILPNMMHNEENSVFKMPDLPE